MYRLSKLVTIMGVGSLKLKTPKSTSTSTCTKTSTNSKTNSNTNTLSTSSDAKISKPLKLAPQKTPAQLAFEAARLKKQQEKLPLLASKSHKEKVAEFNEYLGKLSEHHDIPKVGPG